MSIQGWLYLVILTDQDSRRIVVDALRTAIAAREPDGPLIHHADRGGRYTSDDFRDEPTRHGVECSMSNSGNCYDNAVAESFFELLERERVNRARQRAREDIFDDIEVFDNRKRRHGYLGNISSANFDEQPADLSSTVH